MQLRQCDVAALDAKYTKELAVAKAECCVCGDPVENERVEVYGLSEE